MAKPKSNGIWEEKYPAETYRLHPAEFKRTDLQCCGVKELHGLQGHTTFEGDISKNKDGSGYRHLTEPVAPEAFVEFAKKSQTYWGRFRPYYLFTEAVANSRVKSTRGAAVVAYIEKHRLGEVAIHGPLKNENSGNSVYLFVWMVDNLRLQAHEIVTPEKVDKTKAA